MEHTVFTIGDVVWKTKDGKEIKYRDLSEEHIRNIARIRFVRRYGDCDDEGKPLYYEEHEYDYAEEMELELMRRTICRTLNIEL